MLIGQSSCAGDADVLVTLLKRNMSLTQKRNDIHKHQGKANGFCPKAGTVGGFPFLIPLLLFSSLRVDGNSALL